MAFKQKLFSFILSRLAKAQGFLDPTTVFSNLQRFSKPTEVWVPGELLRSGAVLQARGLINSQAIQHNLDWVWPYWVERQYNPLDKAYIPRAFSITHINLTHRNWTAIGLPDFSDYAIVDPNGLVTPIFDGWSLDAWVISKDHSLIPSKLVKVKQDIHCGDHLVITTVSKAEDLTLETRAQVRLDKGIPVCEIFFKATGSSKTWLAIAPRPYNPEGVSFIHEMQQLPDHEGWTINKTDNVYLSEKPVQYLYSTYEVGDVHDKVRNVHKLNTPVDPAVTSVACPVGMATSVALYELKPGESKEIIAQIPLTKEAVAGIRTWNDHLEDHCVLKIPHAKFKSLYDTALSTLILHSPSDVYPGPFTYKRFWFRDAAFIMKAMITTGLLKNVEKNLDKFATHQTPLGYFESQDGEWDSNGQAIWTMLQYSQMTNTPIKDDWFFSISRGAQWIQRKRTPIKDKSAHAGLLPTGFSAEHFGPSDYYYWDDFWGIAGLRAAACLARQQHPERAQAFDSNADDLLQCIDRSLETVQQRLHNHCIPAAPSRRMDSAAVGGLVASYPLQICGPKDKRVLETTEFLIGKFFIDGCFYHEIGHSGINAYLSLDIAQVLLRADDPRFFEIVEGVARLASATGQWPEAIHPVTKGGCMGDGQHVWAAAEWVLMMRNMFVREEEKTHTLILCSGIVPQWLKKGETLAMGPVLTSYGKITISIVVKESIHISWDVQWHQQPLSVEIHLPGHAKRVIKEGERSADFSDGHVIKDASAKI